MDLGFLVGEEPDVDLVLVEDLDFWVPRLEGWVLKELCIEENLPFEVHEIQLGNLRQQLFRRTGDQRGL